MLNDGDTGEFTTWLVWDEVTVKWTWYEGDDWEADGYFDFYVYQDGVDVTYDISKDRYNWILAEIKERAGYEAPTHQVSRSINAHFNKTF